MQFQDDRTNEVMSKPHLIVLGTDTFLSGWGLARHGPSYAGWACKPEDVSRVETEIRNRSDMKRVRVVGSDYRPPSGPGHVHIYVHRSMVVSATQEVE